MAQSATTVTPPNPTPPTNISCVGATPPHDLLQAAVDDGITQVDATAESVNENIPPSGTSASPQAIAVKVAAAGSGTSVDGEGRGTETVVTATVPNPSPAGQLKTVSVLGNWTGMPNAQHASTQTPATFPVLSSLVLATAAAGTGTQLISCVGTSFVPGCRIWVDNIERATTYVSATSLTTTIPKKNTAGVWAVKVGLGGGFTASTNFTWT